MAFILLWKQANLIHSTKMYGEPTMCQQVALQVEQETKQIPEARDALTL